MNGQLVIWDIGDHIEKLERSECIWDHSVFLEPAADRQGIECSFNCVAMFECLKASGEFSFYKTAKKKSNTDRESRHVIIDLGSVEIL